MKLIIVAGGGGHFAAALAVIQKLPTDWEVLVIGRKYTFEGESTESFEYQTARKLNLRFEALTTGRLQRSLTRHSLVSLAKVPIGYFQALRILKNFQPDVVLSFGGYVSVPVGVAALTLRIPIVVHEQVMSAGLANKVVGKFAKKICISWKQSKQFFPAKKVVLTGNPIRTICHSQESKILHLLSAVQDDTKIIYVTGGSGGAHAINILIEGCLERLLEQFVVVHQTGDAKEFNDFERLSKKKETFSKALQSRYLLTKFVSAEEVFGILEKAHVVVSRSGINTVTELLSFGKPSLLIPFPYGQHNEQLTNAKFMNEIGLSEIGDQMTLTSETLFAQLTKMMGNLSQYHKHSQEASKFIHPDAAENIISVVTHVNQQAKSTKS